MNPNGKVDRSAGDRNVITGAAREGPVGDRSAAEETADAGRTPYGEYDPAYRFGWEAHALNPDCRFEDLEGELCGGWELTHPEVRWEQARPAVKEGWNRADPSSASVGPGNSRIVDKGSW
jgi:hypothetical protein